MEPFFITDHTLSARNSVWIPCDICRQSTAVHVYIFLWFCSRFSPTLRIWFVNDLGRLAVTPHFIVTQPLAACEHRLFSLRIRPTRLVLTFVTQIHVKIAASGHFLTRLLIGWRLCCQPIRSHVRKLLLVRIKKYVSRSDTELCWSNTVNNDCHVRGVWYEWWQW